MLGQRLPAGMYDWVWQCPKCGTRSRAMHRYKAGLDPGWGERTVDPGECVGQLLLFTPKELEP